jgi:TfoX/Sxy family transcriptional regulator of competence genes
VEPPRRREVTLAMAFDEDLGARIRAVLAARDDITERRMFGGLAFLCEGRMCCGVVGRDLMVRVVEDEMPSALREPHVRPMDFTGRPLRGFVYVAPPAIAENDHLRAWVARGLAFTEREARHSKPSLGGARRGKAATARTPTRPRSGRSRD